jgi:hypothetical protein
MIFSELVFPLILAIVGFVIALYQYRSQKAIDRNYELQKEKRIAFTSFIREIDRLINHGVLGNGDKEESEVIIKAKQALNELYLRATPANIQRCADLMEAARILSKHLNTGDTNSKTYSESVNHFNTALTDAVNAARGEFGIFATPASQSSPRARAFAPVAHGIVEGWLLTPDNELQKAAELSPAQVEKLRSANRRT